MIGCDFMIQLNGGEKSIQFGFKVHGKVGTERNVVRLGLVV
jgi:hypothetical protein